MRLCVAMDIEESCKRLSPSKSQNSNASQFAPSIVSLTFKILPAFLLILLSFLLVFTYFYRKTNDFDRSISSFAKPTVLDIESSFYGSLNISTEAPDAKLLGGILSSRFDEESCLSRYQSYMYRKTSPFKPSAYLLSKLRNYEVLHSRCGPDTQPYKEAVKQLQSYSSTASHTDCNYFVWIAYSGLGNRIISASAAFLYALLSNRVLLIDPGTDMTDLFCEPFPGSSWFLPSDFPLNNQLKDFNQKSPKCHGFMLKNKLLSTSVKSIPPYLYLHLKSGYNDYDKQFFCDDSQSLLSEVPWLIMKSDSYFVPSLFLIPSFANELNKLFPEKVATFHHLGRYLFHPTNDVWGLITRYYNAYLAKADERVGIQIRTFEWATPGPSQHVKDQIQSCISTEKLLPQTCKDTSVFASSQSPKSIAILTTSLSAAYYETLRDLYLEYPTVTGEVVGVYQPSHEEYQQFNNKMHSRRAWMEIYLLSLSDKLVTSAGSTFGYVAQGLGGLKPWILYKPENLKTPYPSCFRDMSIEPCFHVPPYLDCKTKTATDTGNLVPHVRHCKDRSIGLKVVDGRDEF